MVPTGNLTFCDWAQQHQFIPEGIYPLGVSWCGGIKVRDWRPGGYSAKWWPVDRLSSRSRCDSQGWSAHTKAGMTWRWCPYSTQPNLQYPVPTRPTWRIPWWEDKPGWKQIQIYPPPKFKKLKFSSKKQPSVFNKHPRRRKRREECANIIQPKHLPAARLFIFIRTVVCYADTCVFFSFDFRK